MIKHMHTRVESGESSVFQRRLRWVYRLVTVAAIIVAIGGQLMHTSTLPTFRPVNFFSYFTIQSNIIAAVVLLLSMLPRRKAPWVDIARGAATFYMAITGIVFTLLLANTEVDLTLPWVDAILHKIVPIVVVLDWLLDPPQTRLHLRYVAWWMVYPLVWLAYTLVRGPFVAWYPYPFVDPRLAGGYGRVAVYAAGIALGGGLLAGLLAVVAMARGAWHKARKH